MSERATGRLQVLAAALIFSAGGAGIKACDLTPWQIASFRSGIAAIVVLLLMPEARRGWSWRVVVAGLPYAATVLLFVLANRLTTSANTIFLQSTAPLYILLAAPFLLRERNRPVDIAVMGLIAGGLALFFVGVDAPRRTAPDPVAGNLLAVLSGVAWALTIMSLRWMGRAGGDHRGSAAGAVVSGNLTAFLIGLPLALPVERFTPVDGIVLAGLGVVQLGLGYVFLTKATRHVPAFEASVLLLVEPALNPIWALVINGEIPGPWAIAGGAVILAATLLKTWADSMRSSRGSAPSSP
ncbi:MAG TPA: DMT family transporter [Candidatus Eisenbacteria bacterium]|nr:DMT family transporter [Candidatus Eisenbacteria bacterium]